jgi:hypothetical protein
MVSEVAIDTHVYSPPWIHTITGSFWELSALSSFGLTTFKFRQSSETAVMLPCPRGGDTFPSGCGHATPGFVASITEPGAGTYRRGGLNLFSPLVSCPYGIP